MFHVNLHQLTTKDIFSTFFTKGAIILELMECYMTGYTICELWLSSFSVKKN